MRSSNKLRSYRKQRLRVDQAFSGRWVTIGKLLLHLQILTLILAFHEMTVDVINAPILARWHQRRPLMSSGQKCSIAVLFSALLSNFYWSSLSKSIWKKGALSSNLVAPLPLGCPLDVGCQISSVQSGPENFDNFLQAMKFSFQMKHVESKKKPLIRYGTFFTEEWTDVFPFPYRFAW